MRDARGDRFVLSHRGLRVEISAAVGRARAGAVVGVGTSAEPTIALMRGLDFAFEHEGNLIEPEVRSVRVGAYGDRAAALVSGRLRLAGQMLTFERALTAGDVPGTLSVRTRVRTKDGVQLRLLELAEWGETPPFVSDVGQPQDDQPLAADWVGAEASNHALVLATGESRGSVRARFHDHGPHRYVAQVELGADASVVDDVLSWRTLVLLRPGSLGQTLRALGWARGAPFPEVQVSLPVRPPLASIRVLRTDGRAFLRTTPTADRRILVPLPHGEEQVDLEASAYGHAPSPRARVRPDGPHHFELAIPTSGQLQVSVTDAAAHAPLPFRLRLVGIEGTAALNLGPDRFARGSADTAVSTDGRLSVEAPPGAYRALVSHGPEWSLLDRRVVITADRGASLTGTLHHQSAPPPGWVACDLHVHAAPSPDSEVSLEDRVAALVAEGVQFAVPTDHNHVTDYAPVLRKRPLPLATTPGVEITTWAPAFGHFNAFPYPRDPKAPQGGAPRYEGREPAELFAELRALDPTMAVQVNHPRLEGGIGYFDQVGFEPATGEATGAYSGDYDLIEVWNGYDLARPERIDRNFAEWLALLQHRTVVATGSSDSHTLRTSWSGYPRTYVHVQGTEPEPREVVAALKAGRAFVTNGPMLLATLEGKGPGERVHATGEALTLRVEVRTPGWLTVDRLQVHFGGGRTEELEPPNGKLGQPSRIRRTLEVEPTAGAFVVVMARGSQGLDDFFGRRGVFPLAFTNPIWIDSVAPPDSGVSEGDQAPEP